MIAPKRVATMLLTFKRAAHNSLGPLCFPGCPVAIQALQYGFMFLESMSSGVACERRRISGRHFPPSEKIVSPLLGLFNCAKCRGARKQFGICLLLTSDQQADLATERERQLTTARANQTTGLTNGRAANWAPEVEFSPFRALSGRQMTFPFCC